jgi:hypothetical protein
MNQPIRKIHLVFKTHLDVGFTDLARNVVNTYFEKHIPLALKIAREMRESDSADRFIWTTGSWLIHEYLDWAGKAERQVMEKAIEAGDIVWHGLPFTTHSELMDQLLFRYGLSLSAGLDKRFGRQTIAAKMTDVPGHTRGIVPMLHGVGIQFLHIGVNAASTPPALPPVFVWSAPDGSDVMVMYHRGGYGALMIVPGLDEAILFAHTGDNQGPQSARDVRVAYKRARERFPGVEVVASTMDDFARALLPIKDTLPVVRAELGDTWIHGTGSDPLKVSQYRELLRLRSGWLNSGQWTESSPEYRNFSRHLLLVPEHTWGRDEKANLWDAPAFSSPELAKTRWEKPFQDMQESWQEQRDYISRAVAGLKGKNQAEAQQALLNLKALRPDTAGMEKVDPSIVHRSGEFDARFDAVSGAIDHLRHLPTNWLVADRRHPLGTILYETFSRADYDRYYSSYIINKKENEFWAVHDFTKTYMPDWVKHLLAQPRLERVLKGKHAKGTRFVLVFACSGEAVEIYGCPHEFWVEYIFPDAGSKIACTVQWFGKSATRIAEAIWLSFVPRLAAPQNWRLDKLGESVSPLEVILNGNRKLHAVGEGVSYHGGDGVLTLRSLDAALVAPGERSLVNFNNCQPELWHGMNFLLYNNTWCTNFPMWYDEDAHFRFEIEVGLSGH